jgi:hypothetical protein
MPHRLSSKRNEYRCSLEINQNGKYCLRVRASFGRHAWVLSVYALASTFDRAFKKLGQTIDHLQRNEDRLWFWSVDRSDDIHLAEEMLRDGGLHLDRRTDFPKRSTTITLPVEKPVPAFLLAPARRTLADTVAGLRMPVASD